MPATTAPVESGAPAASLDTTPVTVTVWDYYGKEVTPFTPDALAAFQAEYPWITVDRQDLDWDTFLDKLDVAVSSGEGPDLATLDMTWIPTLASNGVLQGLNGLSGGTINGQPITDVYSAGPVEAMTYNGDYVTMMYDFDAYALYYRADLFEQKGIAVPKTWDELRAAAKALAEDSERGRDSRQVPVRAASEHLPLLPVPVPERRLAAERRPQVGRLQQPRGCRRPAVPDEPGLRRYRPVLV